MADETQSFADEVDLSFSRNPTVKRSVFGQVRSWSALETFEKIFLVFSLVTLGIVTAFTTVSLVLNVKSMVDQHINTDTVLSIAILINIVFSGYYVYSGVLREKLFDMVILLVSIALLLLYCIGEFSFNFNTIKSDSPKLGIRTARLVLVIIGSAVMIPLAVKVIRSFGFLIFNVIGTDPKLLRLYKQQQFFNSLLIVDLQLGVTTLVLVLVQSSQTFVDQSETITLCIGAPLVVILTVIGYLSARRELRILMIVFEVLVTAVFGYIAFKCYVLNRHSPLSNCQNPLETTGPVISSSTTSTATSSTTSTATSTMPWCYPQKLLYATVIDLLLYTVVHLLMLAVGIVVYRGFGQGLKNKLNEKDGNFTDFIVPPSA